MNSPFVIAFPARAKHLTLLRRWCRIILGKVLAPERLDKLALALSEACANNIEHCFENDVKQQVIVEVEVAKSKVVARVRNFCYAEHAHKIRSRELEDVRPRGLGMRFIEGCVDRVEYVAEGDGFLTLVLTTKRKGGKGGH